MRGIGPRMPGGVACVVALLLALGIGPVMLMAPAAAQDPPEPPPDPGGHITVSPAMRDSLLSEVKRYSHMINALRESLAAVGSDSLERLAGREMLDRAFQEFGGAISSLSRELSDLNLDVDDQRISLTDRDGGRVEIKIPEDLGDQISRGITSITSAILEELPDTLALGHTEPKFHKFLEVAKPLPERRIVGGDAVKLFDDIIVRDDEEVRGNVVAIMGNIVIEGQVNGDVVGVFGDVELTETAEVTGQIFTIGRLDRDTDAEVLGKIVVVQPPDFMRRGSWPGWIHIGWLGFVGRQIEFILVGLLLILLLAVTPPERFRTMLAIMNQNPSGCFAFGVIAALLGHVALVILFGVLVLTVIGIPLALLLLLGYIVAGLLAVATVCVHVGSWFCRRLNLACSRFWVLALVGLLILHLPNLIGSLLGLLPPLALLALLLNIMGIAIKVTAFCYGIGALVTSRLGTPRPLPVTPAPAPQ
jgi:hypothetical protein